MRAGDAPCKSASTAPRRRECKSEWSNYTHARLPSVGREYLPHADAAQWRAAAIHEQRRTAGDFAEQLRPGVAEILFDDGERLFASGNNSFLVALADATNTAHLGIEIGDAQPSEFRYTQAGRV